MADEQQVAPLRATEEAVTPEGASEATENTQGQEKDPPAEAETAEKPEQTEEEKSESQKRRDRRKAQLDRLRQEAAEARAEAEKVRERLEKVRERAAQSDKPPKEGDFQDYNEYLVALGAYQASRQMDSRTIEEIEEAQKAQEARIQQLRQQEQAEVAQSWGEQVQEARQKYADFDRVAYSAPISDGVAQMIARSDMGADVAYHLGTNPDLARQLSAMHPIEAARELGRIEARLSLPKPNTVSSAPDPVTPVRPRSSSGMKDPAKMTYAEYREARMAGKL